MMSEESSLLTVENHEVDLLREISSRIVAADPLLEVLGLVVEVISAVVESDSCFVYVLEKDELVLRASRNPHPEAVDRLKLKLGQGITGWVAEQKHPVAITRDAFRDPRFRSFNELPEDCFQAFLSVPILTRDAVVGVINLQHRQPHTHSQREIHLIGTIAYLVAAKIEMARLEGKNLELSEQLAARKSVERAKGILQRDLGITEEEAYLMLQRQSRQRRKPMKSIAEAVVLGDELKRMQSKPKPS